MGKLEFLHIDTLRFTKMKTPSDAGGFYPAGRAGVSVGSRTGVWVAPVRPDGAVDSGCSF